MTKNETITIEEATMKAEANAMKIIENAPRHLLYEAQERHPDDIFSQAEYIHKYL